MYCRNCGELIEENAAFCSKCGTPVGETANFVTAQPVQVKTNVVVNRIVEIFKSFFSNNVIKGLGTAANSLTHEWAVLLAAYVLFFSLSVPIALKSAISSIAYVGSYISSAFEFGSIFATGLLVSILVNAVIVFAAFLQVKVIYKKDVSIISVLNVVEYASLPVILVSLANMLIGIIWVPLAVILFITAIIMQVILLYAGIQKFGKLEKTPFYVFSLTSFVCVILITIISFLLYKNCLTSSVADFAGDALNNLSGLFY